MDFKERKMDLLYRFIESGTGCKRAIPVLAAKGYWFHLDKSDFHECLAATMLEF